MIPIIIGLLLVVAGTIAYIALRNAQDFSDANEIIPGVPTAAPKSWAGAHSPEARLHRRLRDAMTALRANRSLDEPALVSVREALEREALAIDERLIAAAALAKGRREQPIEQVARAVDAVEATVADIVAQRGPAAAATEQALEDVRARLALVEEARSELEALGGTPSFDRLRAELEATEPREQPEQEPPPA